MPYLKSTSKNELNASSQNLTFNFTPLNGLSGIFVESISCGLTHVLLGTNSKFIYSFG